MVSDTAGARRLSSRRRNGRRAAVLLSLPVVTLSLGAAAWIAGGGSTAPYAAAALPPAGSMSFSDRFAPMGDSDGRAAPHASLDRAAIEAFRMKLGDAKALLAQQLLYADWRAYADWRSADADDDDKPDAGGPRTGEPKAGDSKAAQRLDIPMPRSRPTQADLAAQIASSQAYAATQPTVDNRSVLQKLGDLWPGKVRLASLTPDSGLFQKGPDLAALGYDSRTAVYDISAKALYLPSGVILEAHSGMGNLRDDPLHVDQRMLGATPPATYELKPREKLFHGVRALRMTPVDGSNALGRVGLLTHSYMLGPGGDSNGCVSIKNYDRFLKAYDGGEINRLVVVPKLSGAASASQRTTSDS